MGHLTRLFRFDLFNEAINLNPEDAEIYNQFGELLFKMEDLEGALLLIDTAINLNPKEANFYSNRGNALAGLEKLQEALESYNKAIQLSPNNAITYSNRGATLNKLNRHKEAIENYQIALDKFPNNSIICYNLANTYSDIKDFDQAMFYYDIAIKLNPKYAKAYNNRGKVYNYLNLTNSALLDYNKAIKLNPNVAIFYNNRGQTLFDLGRTTEALNDFEKAIELNLEFADAYYNIGKVMERLDKIEVAIESYRMASDLDSKFKDSFFSNKLRLKKQISAIDLQTKINKIKEKDTNFIFVFGTVASGKTTLIAALMDCLFRNHVSVRLENKYASENINLLHNGEFPLATRIEKVTEFDISVKKSDDEHWTNLTFLDCSGEYHMEMNPHINGDLNEELEIYLRESNRPISFLLVVDYKQLTNEDLNNNLKYNQDFLMHSFISYLITENINCGNVGLVVTKYDDGKVLREINFQDIVRTKLSKSYKLLTSKYIVENSRLFPFSVGEISTMNKKTKITKLNNSDDSKKIVDWLLESFNSKKSNSSNKGLFSWFNRKKG